MSRLGGSGDLASRAAMGSYGAQYKGYVAILGIQILYVNCLRIWADGR